MPSTEKAPSILPSAEAPKRKSPNSVIDKRKAESRTAKEQQMRNALAAQEAAQEDREERYRIQSEIARQQSQEVAARLSALTKKYKLGETHQSSSALTETFEELNALRGKIEKYEEISDEAKELKSLIVEFSHRIETTGKGLKSKNGDSELEARIAKLDFALSDPQGQTQEGSPSVIITEPEMEAHASKLLKEKSEKDLKKEIFDLQNKQADLEQKLSAEKKKMTLGSRVKQWWRSFNGEPETGTTYRIKDLQSRLKEVEEELNLKYSLQEDRHFAKLRNEAKEEFSKNPPSFIKSGGRMTKDSIRDAVASFTPFVESTSEIEAKPYKEAHSTLSKAEKAQYKKELDEMLQSGRKEESRKMTNDELSALGQEFRARRQSRQPEMTPQEVEAKVQAERAKYGWESSEEITDEDILSIEDLPRKSPPPTPAERARRDVRNSQENRYRELLGNRASEVMGTIDNLFAQMSPAEASKLGFSRDQYLDFASGLLHSATESWKDEKTGYTSDDYFKLAQRKLAEYNQKLGLPPDFVTGFGGSRPERMSGLGNNSAREEGARIANRAAGIETPSQARVGRRISTPSEAMPATRETKKTEEYEADLGDLEKGPLDEQFDKLVKDASDTLGREKADVLWNKINKGLEAKQADIKAMNNYDYLNYRGSVEHILRRSPNVKDKSLETALIFSIAELVKGTQDSRLEGEVMNVLNTLGLSKQDVSEILYPQGGTADVKNKRDRMNATMGTYVMTPEEASKYAVDDNGKPLKAEKRGTSRTTSDINRRQNSRRYGGSTATGM